MINLARFQFIVIKSLPKTTFLLNDASPARIMLLFGDKYYQGYVLVTCRVLFNHHKIQ